MSVGFYIKKLIDDATVEGYKLSSMMLGERISNYGVRQCDKDINRRNKLYRDWAMTYIEKRVATINQKIKVKGYSEKPSDIIEALMLDYSNSNSK